MLSRISAGETTGEDTLAISPGDSTRLPLAHPQRRLEMRTSRFADGATIFLASRSFTPALSSIVSAGNRLSRTFTRYPASKAQHVIL